MRPFRRPSLSRRIAMAFLAGYALVLLAPIVFASLVAPFVDDYEVAPDIALEAAFADLDRPGPLALPAPAEVRALARGSPTLWVLAMRDDGETLSFGAVPPEVVAMVRDAPGTLRLAELRLPGDGGSKREVSIQRRAVAGGDLTIAAGGMDLTAIGPATYMLLIYRTGLIWLWVALVVMALPAIWLATRLVLRGVRPLVADAARIDPTDLGHRLSEERTPRELLPLVQAFNGALARVSDAFVRRRRFIADTAHELRTPLAVLGMHVDGLPADAPARADLQRGVFRLAQMIGQMLDAERLALSEGPRERIDLVALARASVADSAPLAIASGYEIALEAGDEPVWIDADRHALSRAVGNLIGNAIAHGGERGLIEVGVSADARLWVSDQGPGIPHEARDRIFEPFHRERWDKDGCGLGLHLVREIMAAHGGAAVLRPSQTGALFELTFPPAASST